jgi:predicted RNase H-like nuclease (RuvC/YqgF family)
MIEPKVMEFSEGDYVRYEDYARLKAECQARQAENSVLAVECDSLKAEVENSKRINTELLVLSNRQASDIRRLTKAGDWLVEAVQTDDCWENWDKGIAKWNAAKNGGQP